RAHAAVVGSALLVEAAAESGLASLRGLELRLERAELRARGDRFAVAGRPRRQLEAQLDVRGSLLLRTAFLFVSPPALQLGAKAGSESLLGLCWLILGFVGHRCLRGPVRRSSRG